MKVFFVAVLFFLVCPFFPAAAEEAAPAIAPDEAITVAVQEDLRLRLESAGLPARLVVAGEPVYAEAAIPAFYLKRLYRPAWSNDGRLTTNVNEMAQAIAAAEADALVPAHYHQRAIEELLAALTEDELAMGQRVSLLADLDLLLSDAFLVLASHYQQGRINPETIDPEWRARRGGGDPLPVLMAALESGRIRQSLRQLLPQASEYAGLRTALLDYRDLLLRGGWPQVPAGPKLARGERSPRVPLLRRRLAASGDLPAGSDLEGEQFDQPVAEGVLRFQRRHGLNPDGTVGKDTLAALNVPLAERIRQLQINLERWRWLPRDLGERHILVNIAAFHAELVEQGAPVFDMRVVVGKPYRRTPVFSATMTYLVLNPYWQVPQRNAVEDILPQVKKDRAYLQKLGLRVFRGWGSEGVEVDPATVDWARLGKKSFPYNLRQEPGPLNALGRVKFMLPNIHDVYLHDTPARELFLKDSRTFSSGCIRLEKPLELASRLLQGTPLGESAALSAALVQPGPRTVRLPRPLPVHLLYWTAWVDGDGLLQLRQDIYGRDALLGQALDQPPPLSP